MKRLRSVVHSVGHHAESGLSFVHPHLGELCKSLAIPSAQIDLLTGSVLLEGVSLPEPVTLSASALSQTFRKLLAKEGVEAAFLDSATIEFDFRGLRYSRACLVTCVTEDGRTLQDAVSMGGRAKVVGRFS